MRIVRSLDQLDGEPLTDISSLGGVPTYSTLLRDGNGHVVAIGVADFAAGVRTNWHRHPGGQVIHVISGRGWIQSRGEQPHELTPGVCVVAEPNEVHWHGASEHAPLAHLGVSIGDTEWLDLPPGPGI